MNVSSTLYDARRDRESSERLEGLQRLIRRHDDAVRQLAAEHRQFQDVFDHSAIGFARVALDGRWLEVNDALCRMLGYDRVELCAGMTWRDVTHPDDIQPDQHLYDELQSGLRSSYQFGKRYQRGPLHDDAGRWFPIILSVSLARDPDGVPVYAVSQIVDVQWVFEFAWRDSRLSELVQAVCPGRTVCGAS